MAKQRRLNNKKKTQKEWTLTKEIKLQLKQIEEGIMPCCEEFKTSIMYSGKKLLEQGVTQVKKGEDILDVKEDEMYEQKNITALRDCDYGPWLRRSYRTGGMASVFNMIASIDQMVSTAKEMYPTLFDEDGMYLGVEEGTILPVNPEYVKQMEEEIKRNEIIKAHYAEKDKQTEANQEAFKQPIKIPFTKGNEIITGEEPEIEMPKRPGEQFQTNVSLETLKKEVKK